jgi:hypothetical protein
MTLTRRIARGRLRRRDDEGVSAVEFALVLPVFIMLMFGVTTAGLAYNDDLSITNAVREGARLGSVIDYKPAVAHAWADAVQQRVQQVYFNGDSTLATSQVCVELVDSTGTSLATPTTQGSCGTAPSLPTGLSSGDCVVRVWVAKPAKISLLVFPSMNFTIAAQSASRYGRTVTPCTA